MQARAPGPHHRGASRGRAPAAEPPRSSDRPELRLALARGSLAIELDAAFELGPLRVEEAVVALPALRFPVDLSGGVSRFRHQRGELVRLVVSATSRALEGVLARRLRDLLGAPTTDVTVAPFLGGAVVGIAAEGRALAFDVHVAPLDAGLRLLVGRARGLGLAAPPSALALRALAAAVGAAGRLERGQVIVDDVAGPVLRAVWPLGGARVPTRAAVRAAPAQPKLPGAVAIVVERDALPAALEPEALRLLELSELVGEADDLAAAGDLALARRHYLRALERAPRHAAIAERLAGIDARVGGRSEAALATLVEATSALAAGVLGAELLSAIGDEGGAHAAFARAAAEEPWSRLASLAWLAAARHASDRAARAHALDEALSRAPLLEEARLERLRARIAAGDLAGARADAELLEAGRQGAEARREIASKIGAELLGAGYPTEATGWFERALRAAPDDPAAVLGLARALRDAGRPRRALDLFARSVALAERRREVRADALLELAKELATTAGDRPLAIARARAIPRDAPEAPEARALEARWRLEIGDRAGAALAAARLADDLELSIEAGRLTPETALGAASAARAAATAAASIARELAQIAERELGHPDLARRLLALAVRAAPRDRRAAGELRRLAREAEVPGAPVQGPAPDAGAGTPGAPPGSVGLADERAQPGREPVSGASDAAAEPPPAPDLAAPAAPESSEDDEVLAERLADRLRADPSDHETARALAAVLERLGRDLELLALASARLEEGDEGARRDFEPVRRACLERLAVAARAAGRLDEASLYESLVGAD